MLSNVVYSKNISWTLLSDSMFVFDEITNKMYLFKGLSRDFWLLIQNNSNISDVIKKLAETNNVEYTFMENKVVQITNKLVKKNLLIWS
ncbi:hypothetical protein AMQ84_17855 [Paenibacillus riograndensis]|uniref:PqqD family protein n=1 Tax=Paenibacillus riograndensis TaxID=483937 RepID=A0A132TVU6_9BACL|nr:hypothetical protein AMQ84_17855 [Paenibacillus riograndensis]